MNPRFAMLAAMLALTAGADAPIYVPEPPRPEPERAPRPLPGVIVVHGRDDWGRQPEPVFLPWGRRPPQPHHSRRPGDSEAIAAAEAKRARKAKKRLSV